MLKDIPKRKVTTYKILARQLDTSPRAIGKMLNSNKDTKNIPCYKVVMSNGNVGGYVLGEKQKILRLKEDGILVKKGKVINFNKHVFSSFSK